MGPINATALVAPAPGAALELTELSIDEPRADEVLVRIEAVGICHADVLVMHGQTPFPLPGVPGHEGVGVVEKIGPAVDRIAIGDRVILTFDSCGECPRCRAGHPTQCSTYLPRNFASGARQDGSITLSHCGHPIHGNFFGQSSFGTYALANQRNAVPTRTDVAPSVLAALGCGVQTGAGAVFNALAPVSGNVVVFGLGAVGMSAIMAARIVGARPIAIDLSDDRLALARELGAAAVVNARTEDPGRAIRELTGDGADFAIECSGSTAAFAQALACLRPGGTLGVIGASFGVTAPVDIADLVNRSVRIVGIVEGDSLPHEFIPRLVEFVERGELPVERLVKTFPLREAAAAMDAMASGEAIKPVLIPD